MYSTFSDSGDLDSAHVEKSYSYDTDWFDKHIDSSNFANTLGKLYHKFLIQGLGYAKYGV